MLGRRDIVHIEHDDILVFEIGKPFVNKRIPHIFQLVDLRGVNQRRAEGNAISRRKISAVYFPLAKASLGRLPECLLQIACHIANAGMIKPGTVDFADLCLINGFF